MTRCGTAQPAPIRENTSRPGPSARRDPAALGYGHPTVRLVAALAVLLLCGRCGSVAAPAQPADGTAELDPEEPPVTPFADDADPSLAGRPADPDILLVQTFPGIDRTDVDTLVAELDGEVLERNAEIDLTVLRIDPERSAETGSALAASGLLERVERNHRLQADRLPNDPLFTTQTHLTVIRAPQAWNAAVGLAEVRIAVVDTGVDAEHPDVADRVVDGWNVYEDDADYRDVMGHGTMVAGMAAALTDNGVGVAGVTWEGEIIAVRAADEEGYSTARHIAAGILRAVDLDADVINVSFAPLQAITVVQAACDEAFHRGAVVVISSGNSGQRYTSPGYDSAVFVGAVDDSDVLASFSDRGPYVDLVAPGKNVLTTLMDGEYGLVSGTSFSAPIVSGVLALGFATNPDLRPMAAIRALTETAEDLGTTGRDDSYGHGRADAEAFLQRLVGSTLVGDETPPTVRITRPSSSARYSRRFTISVTASDDEAVSDVVLSIDGIPVATDTRAPYRLGVDPTRYPTGTHELSVVATDDSGNVSSPAIRTVTFVSSSATTSGSGTSIRFISPASGARVSGDTRIVANLSDSNGLATVQWFIDGESVFTAPVSGTSSTVSYQWRAGSATKGNHNVTIVVLDAAGDRSTASLTLRVS